MIRRWRREIVALAAVAAISSITQSRAAEPIVALQTTTAQAPGLPDGVTFTRLGQPLISANGGVVFNAIVGGGDISTNNDTGMWASTGGGAFAVAAREDDPVPGHSALYFSDFPTINAGAALPILTPQGGVGFTLSIRAGQTSAGGGAFLRISETAPLQTIARSNVQRPDGSGNWGSGAFNLALNPSGRFVLRDSASYLYTGTSAGALELVARPGQVLEGRTIENIGSASITRGGTAVFMSNADPEVADARHVVFGYKTAAPTNVARLLTPGDPAPGIAPATQFLRADNVAYANSSGEFVVAATAAAGGVRGVWKGNFAIRGLLTKVLSTGDAAAGAPGASFVGSTRQYVSGSGLIFISADL